MGGKAITSQDKRKNLVTSKRKPELPALHCLIEHPRHRQRKTGRRRGFEEEGATLSTIDCRNKRTSPKAFLKGDIVKKSVQKPFARSEPPPAPETGRVRGALCSIACASHRKHMQGRGCHFSPRPGEDGYQTCTDRTSGVACRARMLRGADQVCCVRCSRKSDINPWIIRLGTIRPPFG